ncbi:hypothetical protein SCACP_21480 [Sporomusa carbonis]|uniref:hypothetical protein n=1 Tax=Sporomusa carbonis TaxID=3076075 RepID=UPI003A75DA5A
MPLQVIKDLSEILTTSDGLAGCIGLSRPRVIQLANEGILDRDKNSKYVVADNIKRYIDYIKNGGKTTQSSDEFQADYWEEKAIHEKAKRELTEIKLAKIQGKMHDARDVELVMTEMLINLRTQLLGLPSNLAPQLAGKTQEEIYDMMNREIESKLNELRDYSPALFEGECLENDTAEDD